MHQIAVAIAYINDDVDRETEMELLEVHPRANEETLTIRRWYYNYVEGS